MRQLERWHSIKHRGHSERRVSQDNGEKKSIQKLNGYDYKPQEP